MFRIWIAETTTGIPVVYCCHAREDAIRRLEHVLQVQQIPAHITGIATNVIILLTARICTQIGGPGPDGFRLWWNQITYILLRIRYVHKQCFTLLTGRQVHDHLS